jgi:DNA-binding MarR family transcriptional regulator
VLLNIDRHGRLRLSDLASAEGLNPTMLSRVVAGMVQDGLVERSCDEGDRRAAWVAATSAGHKLAERMRRERTDAINAAMSGLGAEDSRSIARALPALEALSKELKSVRP